MPGINKAMDAGVGVNNCGAGANAITIPPGEYDRKVETQRKLTRGRTSSEYVVSDSKEYANAPRLTYKENISRN